MLFSIEIQVGSSSCEVQVCGRQGRRWLAARIGAGSEAKSTVSPTSSSLEQDNLTEPDFFFFFICNMKSYVTYDRQVIIGLK